MRKVNKIIIHCSDSDVVEHGKKMKHFLHKWHVEERGYSDIGYHFAIDIDGIIIPCRKEEEIGAHCYGYNRDSIGICLHGKLKFSEPQFRSLKALIEVLYAKYKLTKDEVFPHCHFDDGKTCPNFDVKTVIK